MTPTDGRQATRFPSGGEECAAWHYPGSNGGCVVMAGGFAVNKEPATEHDQAAAIQLRFLDECLASGRARRGSPAALAGETSRA